MTLKKLFMLGGVLAGAAYLQDKTRRDRVFGQARGAFDKMKTRAAELSHKAEQVAGKVIPEVVDKTKTATADLGRRDNGFGSSGIGGSTVGSGGIGSGGLGGSGNYR